MKKNTSDAKIAANRRNAKKSTGPNDMGSTRFNATKHGLLGVGLTELDDLENYRHTLRDLEREKQPVGELEIFLVGSAALDIVRLRRARRLEAEYVTSMLNPPVREGSSLPDLDLFEKGALTDAGLPATMHHDDVQRLVTTYQRYESAIALRLFRTLHELERMQRIRGGEQLPAPTAIDVTIDVDRHVTAEPSADHTFEGSLSSHPEKVGESKSGTPVEENDSTGPPE
jgi:hypothetical protein